jgi:hypothetical protein
MEKLRKCLRCHNSQALAEFLWGYHFEPGCDHPWCRTCQFKPSR